MFPVVTEIQQVVTEATYLSVIGTGININNIQGISGEDVYLLECLPKITAPCPLGHLWLFLVKSIQPWQD